MEICELLGVGARNAKTARELKEVLHVSRREITRAIQYARLHGVPIMAKTTPDSEGNAGYYLAEDAHERESYTKSLRGRIAELQRTLDAVQNAHSGDLRGV